MLMIGVTAYELPTRVAVHEYAAFYDESNDNFNTGRVVWLVKTINFHKSYVCFQCDIDLQSNVEASIAMHQGISETDSLWDAKLSKNIIWRPMKCLILKLDNYGKDVETVSLQKVHINQLVTFQRNHKQVAKGKTVKAKGQTPTTAKDGHQNYPKCRGNEETVCVRTLRTMLEAQKNRISF